MSSYKEWLYEQTNPYGEWYGLRDYTTTLPWDGSQKGLFKSSSPEWYDLINRSIACYRSTKVKFTRTRTMNGYTLEYEDWRMTFKTKQAIKDYYKCLKDQVGDEGRPMTPLEQKITKALFVHHHEYVVSDDEDFYVDRNLSGQWSYFVNGQAISYVKCVNYVGKNSSEKLRNNRIRNFLKACRNTIVPQIMEVEKTHPGDHIDHDIIPFNNLVKSWLQSEGYKISEIGVSDDYPYYLSKPYFESWSEYHRANATLKPLAPRDNMSKQPPRINWLNLY